MEKELEIPAHELEVIINRAAADTSYFKSADLKGLSLTYTYEETIHEITDTVRRSSAAPIHKDLQKAFRALSAHLAVIIEDVAPDDIYRFAGTAGDIDWLTNIPEYDDNGDRIFRNNLEKQVACYDVTGVAFSKAGIVLSGTCKLTTDEFIDVTTPRIKWEESTYAFLNELRAAVDTLLDEIRLYKNGKTAPVAHQGDLFEEQLEAA